jgi:hypothetical protein
MGLIKFYQNGKRNGETVETFSIQFQIDDAVNFDKEKFASTTANKLMEFKALAERAERTGRKLSFSSTKPLWFEFNSGLDVVKSSETVAKSFGAYVKGKSGKESHIKTEMREMVLILLDAMEIARSSGY